MDMMLRHKCGGPMIEVGQRVSCGAFNGIIRAIRLPTEKEPEGCISVDYVNNYYENKKIGERDYTDPSKLCMFWNGR